jgi:NET1-associated nuclear protein 1 (U3 small nucleolar RNA-associated protein 17)
LAVVGVKDLVLWDLVAQCGMFQFVFRLEFCSSTAIVRWHYKSSWELDTVVSHTVADIFALFHRPSSPTNEWRQTRISLFHTSSSIPSSLHSVPFGLRNVVWYSTSSTSESSSFSLVGITHAWSVVLLGDSVRLPEEEGSTAREIVADSTLQKRTLFQDIFGKSAFSDFSNEQSSSKPRTTTTRPWSGREAASIFDGPAYLVPPLESLFEPLINSFLKTRPEDTNTTVGGNAEVEDGDADMEEEGGDRVVSRTQPKRVVDRDEIDSFVDLFKMHTVQCMSTSTVNRTIF